MFKYFLGKLYMQQEQFDTAEEALVWAFAHCKPNTKLKTSILECLVVVRLRLGKMPSHDMICRYKIPHYLEILESVQFGNIGKFEHAMATYWRLFTDDGTFFVLERMKFLVYRTCLKNTYIWTKKHMPNEVSPHIMPIGVFTAAFKWQVDQQPDQVVQFDDDEMMCIMANLIKMTWIKVKGTSRGKQAKWCLVKNPPFLR